MKKYASVMLIAIVVGIMIAGGALAVTMTAHSVYAIGSSGQIQSHGGNTVNGGNGSGGDGHTLSSSVSDHTGKGHPG
jgi:hypothetical protein